MPSRSFIDKILLLSALLFFSLLIQPLYALERAILQKQGVTLFFKEPLRSAAEEAGDLYPAIKIELETTIGWKIDFSPKVILINNGKDFQRMADSKFIAAFAVPARGLIVIDYSKMKTAPFSIRAVMKHELCHLLLHSHIKRGDLPKWLDEGIAQWVSGGLADIVMTQKDSVLHRAVLSDRLISIRAMTESFPREKRRLMLAYAESRSLVEYIIGEYELDGILKLLDLLKSGESPDSAILKAFEISFDELERRWYNSLKKRITWFVVLANNLYGLLFFAAALILIIGFIRVLIKKREYEGSEEEDPFFS